MERTKQFILLLKCTINQLIDELKLDYNSKYPVLLVSFRQRASREIVKKRIYFLRVNLIINDMILPTKKCVNSERCLQKLSLAYFQQLEC